jgi:hypothetical protein
MVLIDSRGRQIWRGWMLWPREQFVDSKTWRDAEGGDDVVKRVREGVLSAVEQAKL